ncbi:MAG: imidazole glycerol phosphate synthase subunit HisH [Phycisphaerales bacterium]|nr:imidazole glycerol phosphate synthase subunit HisH [Phycisphaerales bacterium]
MISILDYGMGNLRSVGKAFEQQGIAAQIINTAEQTAAADKLILPGVGAFADAMEHLRRQKLVEPIRHHVQQGKLLLGICLGLQLLFEVGYEDGTHEGLGLLRGACVRFDVDKTMKLKIPHMGWNQLNIQKPSPLLAGLDDQCNVYFVHSYHVQPQDKGIIATTTDYGRPFVSSIASKNIYACQFHPEKSQAVGLRILRNFAEINP